MAEFQLIPAIFRLGICDKTRAGSWKTIFEMEHTSYMCIRVVLCVYSLFRSVNEGIYIMQKALVKLATLQPQFN